MGFPHPKIGNYFVDITCFDCYLMLVTYGKRKGCGITMQRQLHDSLTENKRLLTTEKGKMYGIYILDGFTGDITELHDESIFDNWYDHCINPKHFKELANRYNCEYTLETFYKVTEEYNSNYLNIDSLLETSVNGERIVISGNEYGDNDYIFIENNDGSEIVLSSSTELNEWLVKNELRPFPVFCLPEGKEDVWVSLNSELFPSVEFKTFCKYSVEGDEFTVISVHMFGNLIINIDFEKYWSDFQLIDAMDTLYYSYGVKVDNIFDLTSLIVNESSVNSRDLKIQLGEQTLERGNYREFATKEELIQAVKNEYELDLTNPVDELIKESEKL